MPVGNNACPDFVFYLAETLLVLDHQRQQARLVGNVFCGEQAMQSCFGIGKRLEQLNRALQGACVFNPALESRSAVSAADVQVDISDEAFTAQVEQLKHNIVAGDVFQVVPSRCFSLPCPSPLAA